MRSAPSWRWLWVLAVLWMMSASAGKTMARSSAHTVLPLDLNGMLFRSTGSSADGPLANLYVRDITVSSEDPATCVAGPVGVGAVIVNHGRAEPEPIDFEVRLSIDGTPHETVTVGGVSPKAPNGESGWKQTAFHGVALTAGDHELVVTIDPNDHVKEWNKEDNTSMITVACQASSPPQNQPAPGQGEANRVVAQQSPDLQISKLALNSDGHCSSGTKNAVTALLRNAGKSEAQDFSIRLTIDGQPAGTKQIDNLADGKELSVAFHEVRLTKGKHAVRLEVDPKKDVDEGNEQNNVSSIDVSCTGG